MRTENSCAKASTRIATHGARGAPYGACRAYAQPSRRIPAGGALRLVGMDNHELNRRRSP